MTPAAPLLLALALGADAQLDVGLRLDAGARRTHPPTVPDERTAVDLGASPRLGFQVRGADASVSAFYAPRFAELSVGRHGRKEYMHEGEARVRLQSRPSLRLEVFGTGGVGKTDLLSESLGLAGAGTGAGSGTGTSTGGTGTGTGTGGTGAGTGTGTETGAGAGTGAGSGTGATTLLSAQRIGIERWRTGASLELAPDRRTAVVLSGAVAQDGGTDAAARASYPVVRTVDATAELRWSASRLDHVGLRLAGTQGRLAALRADAGWASAMATWRRQLSPRVQSWAGAGAVVLRSRSPSPGSAVRTSHGKTAPAAELGVARSGEAMELSGELAGTLGATIDRLSGQTTQAAAARSRLSWPWTRAVALELSGAGSLSWTEGSRLRTGQLGAGLTFALAPWLRLGVGGAGTWQRVTTTGSASEDLESYAGTVSLSLEPAPLRF